MKNQSILSFENEVYNYFIFIKSLYSFMDEDEIKIYLIILLISFYSATPLNLYHAKHISILS
jgi:hypothetical protein